MIKKIGLISGSGKFPCLFAKAAKERGLCVVAIAVKNNTNPNLRRFVDNMQWFRIDEFQKMVYFLNKNKIKNVVMAGQIDPSTLYDKNIMKDEQLKNLLLRIEDRRADSIFKAIADMLGALGITLMDSTIFLKDFLPKEEILTKSKPTKEIWENIWFGFQMAKKIGGLDIGQTVVVKQKTIVAVEAIEGTDRTILRAGKIANGGCVIVKVSKPNQDKRFDIPVIGLKTVENSIKIKAKCLAFEAKKTLLFDKEKCIKLAQKSNLVIVAI